MATAGTSAVVGEAATTQDRGKITSAAAMAKAAMVVADMEGMDSRVEMDMANKVEMAMDRVDMEEMEADTLEEGMVVAAVAAVEGDIRNDGIR